MWGRLRIILLIASALLWAFFAYVVIDSSVIHPHKEPILDYVVVYGIFIYLGVNFIYGYIRRVVDTLSRLQDVF